MTEIACCFTGHRTIPEGHDSLLSELLRSVVRELYLHDGIKTYYTGGAKGFDTLAAMAVLAARECFPEIYLVVVLPYANHADSWKTANEVICLADHYYNGCMFVRNRYLVDHSSICVSYQTKQTGGTAFTVKYASKKGVKVINLAESVKIQNEGDNQKN